MLAEERYGKIISLVNDKKSVTVQELMDYLDAPNRLCGGIFQALIHAVK